MSWLSASRIKKLWNEYKAIKDGRIYRGVMTHEIEVERTRHGWIIHIYGIEAKQRDILMEDMERIGMPHDVAGWIAARCPTNLLPKRSVVEALAALEQWDEERWDNQYFSPRAYGFRIP